MSVSSPLTLALPKGRLEKKMMQHLAQAGFDIHFEDRKLCAQDSSGKIEVFLVKNVDLPTYVHHGIAGIGICGDDLLYEANLPLYKLMELSFGLTRICLIGREGSQIDYSRLQLATKFPRFSRDYFHKRNVPVELVKLNGSVELAAVLGLTPYIVDLVETGDTLRANHLEVLQELKTVRVNIIVNPAYYKYHYQNIKHFLKKLGGQNNAESPA